ncbi:transcription regulator protein [Dissulfurispira thermophila]|uniref:Transcription regulator protein n=2 Tax=root TaxID=1 RepID=A0A7G1H2X1_9BACT|nr:MerR family transcriptional regulator [Dissulfurispira thermophila]BCB96491.1 transcription regulator protein [Dissulfurispira thermophila]
MQDALKSPEPLRLFPEKLFYKIGEVSRIVGIESYVLRYWETEFPFLTPKKSKSGQRIYTKKDIDLILQIKRLLYDERYTIDGVRRKLGGNINHAPEVFADINKIEKEEMRESSIDAKVIISLVKTRLREILRNNFGA